jgi:hypothetical protein
MTKLERIAELEKRVALLEKTEQPYVSIKASTFSFSNDGKKATFHTSFDLEEPFKLGNLANLKLVYTEE